MTSTDESTPAPRAADASAPARDDWPTGGRSGLLASVLRHAVRLLEWLFRRAGRHVIVLDYPPSSATGSRYGFGSPPHRRLDKRLAEGIPRFESSLRGFAKLLTELKDVPVEEEPGGDQPHWRNAWLTGLDAVSLYGYLRQRNPAQYVEVGSGVSTRWARRAIRDGGLRTEITSIDPVPRRDIAHLADHVVRTPLELTDLDLFGALEQGDVVFMDGSHRVFTSSDATVFVLDVLPALAGGVLVGIDDILLPFDYPPPWRERYYSEQYLVAAYLLGGGSGARVEFPSYYVHRHPTLGDTWRKAWNEKGPHNVDPKGLTFWMETTNGQ